MSTFARDAIKIVIDVDGSELRKAPYYGMTIEHPIEADAKYFISLLLQSIDEEKLADLSEWKKKISGWKSRYPICPDRYYQEEAVNPYVFVKELSAISGEGDTIFVDTGCSVAWVMQTFEFKYGQRLFHDFNNTAMGYALPASIGASVASAGEGVTCITGDGSLQMNIQELATVIHYQLPVRIFVMNNRGYSMIQQTQDQWMESRYIASSPEGGVAAPDFDSIAQGYGYETYNITSNGEIRQVLQEVFEVKGPVLCQVHIMPEHRVTPQVKFGRPIEDSEPLLSRDDFNQAMIVSPLDVSSESE